MVDLLRQFGEDPTVRMLAGLVVIDLVFGVGAAFKTNSFRLAYLADFMRNDVLSKLVPYYGLWAVLHLVGDINIGGFDAIEEVVAGAIGLALGGSILNSARDLKFLPASTPNEVAGPDPAAPGPPPAPPS